MPDSFDGFWSLWQGGSDEGYASSHVPPAIFKNVFDVYYFSIISNLFHSNKPYAFSTYIENVRTKCIIFGEALRIRVEKLKQNLRENYSKSTKTTITASKFSKFFRGSMPPNHLWSFCVSISFKLALPKTNMLEKRVKIMAIPLLKFLATPLRRDESDRCSLGPH